MNRVLIIADDLTGALDSGVKFARYGIRTCVCIDADPADAAETTDSAVKVLVVPSRHASPADAYHAVYAAVTQNPGFTVLIKKTDSALRGNIGAELAAVRDASKARTVYFLPAFPQMNRITRGGVQYIDGTIPVAESVFGTDPFNPVVESYVPRLLNRTTDTPVNLGLQDDAPGITVLDIETENDMLETVRRLICQKGARILAGCAGLTEVLPRVLEMDRTENSAVCHASGMLVFCGSVNPVSIRQCQHAAENGTPIYHLIQDEQCLHEDAAAEQIVRAAKHHSVVAFDTGSDQACAGLAKENGEEIAQKMGRIICRTIEAVPDSVPFIIGGDTLIAFLNCLGIRTIFPVQELLPGVVLAKYPVNGAWQHLVSKSGGFGEPDLLQCIARQIVNQDTEEYTEVRKNRC